jgi:hypothetical protein
VLVDRQVRDRSEPNGIQPGSIPIVLYFIGYDVDFELSNSTSGVPRLWARRHRWFVLATQADQLGLDEFKKRTVDCVASDRRAATAVMSAARPNKAKRGAAVLQRLRTGTSEVKKAAVFQGGTGDVE